MECACLVTRSATQNVKKNMIAVPVCIHLNLTKHTRHTLQMGTSSCEHLKTIAFAVKVFNGGGSSLAQEHLLCFFP
jgi:hypothetical protein